MLPSDRGRWIQPYAISLLLLSFYNYYYDHGTKQWCEWMILWHLFLLNHVIMSSFVAFYHFCQCKMSTNGTFLPRTHSHGKNIFIREKKVLCKGRKFNNGESQVCFTVLYCMYGSGEIFVCIYDQCEHQENILRSSISSVLLAAFCWDVRCHAAISTTIV